MRFYGAQLCSCGTLVRAGQYYTMIDQSEFKGQQLAKGLTGQAMPNYLVFSLKCVSKRNLSHTHTYMHTQTYSKEEDAVSK